MTTLKRWQLGSTSPYALQIGADARLSQTDYLDDQSWELSLGLADTPALVLQSQYGGRVGLASLVPMWQHEGRMIYQAQTYAKPPIVTAFAAGYLQAQAKLIPELDLTAEYWVMESHAVGGRFTVTNVGPQEERLHVDLFGHVGARRKDIPLAIITLVDETHALSMGRLPGLEPVVVLENAQVTLTPGSKASPKIGVDLIIQPGETVYVRWVHSGLSKLNASLERAQFWLGQDWDQAVEQIASLAQTIPTVETGDSEHDATIAFSYMHLMQSFMRPTTHLPYTSFIASRNPPRGFSRRGDGTDYERGWQGQSAQMAYLIALAAAPIDAELAHGIVRNFISVQQENGWVDMQPGLGGQQQGLLCPPFLARMAWEVYQYTQDETFLNTVFHGLLDFFNRWSEADVDTDGNIVPEWQDERQTGYTFWPTFGAGQAWAQNVDISSVESPDLVAYMLSEAVSLQLIAEKLGDVGAYELSQRVIGLREHLQTLWDNDAGRYTYVDHNKGKPSKAVTILDKARADEEQIIALKLATPARVIVRVAGGTSKVPKATLHLEGLDSDGNSITETVTADEFAWGYGSGSFTSTHLYAQVDRIKFDGLSRVYRISATTVDLTRLDINGVVPIWVPGLTQEFAERLMQLITDDLHFLRPSGLTIVSAQDVNFDPSSARGGGGTWAFWTTLIGEGLLNAGYVQEATIVLKRLLETQTEVLKRQKRFAEFYHSDEPIGLGEDGYLSGIVPLHLLMRVLGVRIVNNKTVWTGGAFTWGTPVTVSQNGMTISRSESGTTVTFASGHIVKLDKDAEWQEVIDPSPTTTQAIQPIPITPPEIPVSELPNRVIIQVDHDETDG